MRVALLVPRIHFHAPFVLRALAPRAQSGEDRYLVVTTPKLSARREPLARKVAALWRSSGPDYLLSMAAARALHAARGGLERLRGVAHERRKSLSVAEACRLIDAETLAVRSVRDPQVAERLREFRPDVLCAVFFNQIVPPELREIPARGSLNVHPSWLPRYRGVSPCFWVLARGEAETGVTVHRMTGEIDRGPLLARARVEIGPRDTVDSLYRRAAERAGGLLACLLAQPALLEEGFPEDESGSWFGGITREAVAQLRARGRRFF